MRAYTYIYSKILPVASAHQTDPSSGAKQTHPRNGATRQRTRSHLDDDLRHGAWSQPGVPSEGLLCPGNLAGKRGMCGGKRVHLSKK